MKVLHTADLHFSVKPDKLEEVVRVSDVLLQGAAVNPPDLIILAGDFIDQYDGKIPADSACFRAAKSFMRRAADIAPVVMVRGTKSHDKDISGLFDDISTRCPIHVASDVEQIKLVMDEMTGCIRFLPLAEAGNGMESPVAVFTLTPSLDKSFLAANGAGGIASGNMEYRQLLYDLFAGLGLVNDSLPYDVPRIFVGHGLLTGAVYSTGQSALGEDMEFSVNDLLAANCDAYMLGHIHKYQAHAGGKIVYSGSPARLNYGEVETKGYVEWKFDGRSVVGSRFVELPARRFHFVEGHVEEGMVVADYVRDLVEQAKAEANGADVRLRFDVPEEFRSTVDRAEIERLLLEAGALKVKIEMQVIPKQRQRAAGISNIKTLPEKVVAWGTTVDVPVPADVLALAGKIEGLSVEELLVMVTAEPKPAVAEVVPLPIPPADDLQAGLFEEAV